MLYVRLTPCRPSPFYRSGSLYDRIRPETVILTSTDDRPQPLQSSRSSRPLGAAARGHRHPSCKRAELRCRPEAAILNTGGFSKTPSGMRARSGAPAPDRLPGVGDEEEVLSRIGPSGRHT